MNTKTLSPRALSVIDQYMHFHVGSAVAGVPYFNNNTAPIRGALRADIGKGSPREIFDEMRALLVKNHVPVETLADESLKKFLTDNNIGIDCSGFAYYVLNAESQELGKGALDRHLTFVKCVGFVRKIKCRLRPVENCDVSTLADDKNSRVIPISDTKPGDMITMIGGQDGKNNNHILVIHQIEYQNSVPIRLHYSHAMKYPEDTDYNTGIRQGSIEIVSPEKPLMEARWVEEGREGKESYIFQRAQPAKVELRRLGWLI